MCTEVCLGKPILAILLGVLEVTQQDFDQDEQLLLCDFSFSQTFTGLDGLLFQQVQHILLWNVFCNNSVQAKVASRVQTSHVFLL